MDEQKLEELYRLAKDNNRMLHAMRRNAFWGGVIKFILYAALIIVPLWLYATYLAPMVNQMLETVNQIQGTGASAQAQLGNFQDMLKRFQENLPSLQQ